MNPFFSFETDDDGSYLIRFNRTEGYEITIEEPGPGSPALEVDIKDPKYIVNSDLKIKIKKINDDNTD